MVYGFTNASIRIQVSASHHRFPFHYSPTFPCPSTIFVGHSAKDLRLVTFTTFLCIYYTPRSRTSLDLDSLQLDCKRRSWPHPFLLGIVRKSLGGKSAGRCFSGLNHLNLTKLFSKISWFLWNKCIVVLLPLQNVNPIYRLINVRYLIVKNTKMTQRYQLPKNYEMEHKLIFKKYLNE